MHHLCVSMLVLLILHGFLGFTGAEDTPREEGKGREKREMPNWSLWSSDFTGWLQELTAQAGYDRIQNLARTYWAHFPIASYLGYDSPEENPDGSEEVPE
ncbi:otospiralin [Esox lucius]|uniref:otospiralin n=1 Tax=Esox lucius TaxID=8010 RepID=UPI00097343DA|nr:otospiralin [Esox lucius]